MNITHTFAQISPTEFTGLIALFAGMLTGFYALVKSMLSSSDKNSQRDREERLAMIKAIEDMAISNREIAEEQRKGNKEAEERNGHLAELTIESKQATLDAIRCIKVKQNVEEQTVREQIVKHETKE
jgi:hypothetical protein